MAVVIVEVVVVVAVVVVVVVVVVINTPSYLYNNGKTCLQESIWRKIKPYRKRSRPAM